MSDTMTLTKVNMDWDNFDRVVALRYADDYQQLIINSS